MEVDVPLTRICRGFHQVSRSLGDFLYKHRADLPDVEQQVSAEPEMTVLDRKSGDDYLILCCDGIWDVMTNEEVVEFVRNKVLKGETRLGKVWTTAPLLCVCACVRARACASPSLVAHAVYTCSGS